MKKLINEKSPDLRVETLPSVGCAVLLVDLAPFLAGFLIYQHLLPYLYISIYYIDI